MSFLNSLSTRIPLALIGGVLYGCLTYSILILLDLAPFSFPVAILVFLFYLGSRLLILFSGVDSPYYAKKGSEPSFERSPFYQTAQWVGKFYHLHDFALLLFLAVISIAFLITLMADLAAGRPVGQTFQGAWNSLNSLIRIP